MPAYNCASYIREAVQSVIDQTEQNWELIILDDRSTDDTAAIVSSIRDPRIILTGSEENIGQANQLNKGIAMARGEFIAVAHGDDINEPTRLKEQLAVFKQDASVGVVGTWIRYVGERTGTWEYPVGSANCFLMMLEDSPLAHPTVMIRKSVLARLPFIYRQELVPAEDYDLWARLSAVTRFENVPRYLLRYRVHHFQVSKRKEAELANRIERVKSEFIRSNFGFLPPAETEILSSLIRLGPGAYLSRSLIKGASRLAHWLDGYNQITERQWKNKINQLLARGLMITKKYEPGTGIYFLLLNPGMVFRIRPSHLARIILRSVKTKTYIS